MLINSIRLLKVSATLSEKRKPLDDSPFRTMDVVRPRVQESGLATKASRDIPKLSFGVFPAPSFGAPQISGQKKESVEIVTVSACNLISVTGTFFIYPLVLQLVFKLRFQIDDEETSPYFAKPKNEDMQSQTFVCADKPPFSTVSNIPSFGIISQIQRPSFHPKPQHSASSLVSTSALKSEPPSLSRNISESIDLHTILSEKEVLSIFKSISDKADVSEVKSEIEKYTNELRQIEDLCRDHEPAKFLPGMPIGFGNHRLNRNVAREYAVVRTQADGNCGFYGYSQSLFGHGKYTHLLRLLQVRHMVQEEAQLKTIFKPGFGTEFEKVFASTKTLGHWAEGANHYMMSEIIQRPILIHEPPASSIKEVYQGLEIIYNSNPDTVNKTPVRLIHTPGHFESLIPLVDDPKFVTTSTAKPYNTGYVTLSFKNSNVLT